MVVEDDRLLRKLLTAVLQLDGKFRTIGAEDIHKAETMLAEFEHPFAAVLLDATLPDGDGLQFCRKLRSEGFQRPIVILTGHVGEEAEQRSLAHGATMHLSKPINIDALIDRIGAIVQDSGEQAR